MNAQSTLNQIMLGDNYASTTKLHNKHETNFLKYNKKKTFKANVNQSRALKQFNNSKKTLHKRTLRW